MPDDADRVAIEADVSDLVEYCAAFARKHGVDAMLDALAGVYQAHAPIAEDFAIKIAWDLAAGSDAQIVAEIDEDGLATYHRVQ